jgi:peptidyl-prolyl cis-trans isomerase SurA
VNRSATSVSSSSLSLLLALGLAAAAPRPSGAEVLNRIVLRVNDRIATLHDYEKRKNEMVQDLSHRDMDAAERQKLISQAGELTYKDMFDELLLQSRADQLGVEVTDKQVDDAVRQTRESNNLQDDQQWAQALQQSGLTEAKLRAQIKSNLRVQDVIGREVRAKIKFNEEDLRRYYGKHPDEFRVPDQVQVREIVIPEDKVPSAAERARVAGEIRRALLAGKPMADAVAAFKAQGEAAGPTDIGWVSAGDLDPALGAAAMKLQKGGVTEPIAGRGGLHVLQVLDRREAHVRPFNEVSGEINAKESQRVFRDKLTEYMADLQKQSLVVAQPPQEAAGYRRLLSTGAQTPIPGLSTPDASQQPNPPVATTPGSPGATLPGPAAGPGSAPAPDAPGGLPTPKPVDPTTPPPVAPPPAQTPPPAPPPPTR